MTQRLDQIFDLRYGHSLELNALAHVKPPDGVNFVSRAMGNNGVTARVTVDVEPAKAGEISVALSGNGVLSSFVQPEPFVCGYHVMILTAKNPSMSLSEKLWWARCIWENRYRFSYGRQAKRTLGSLLVPVEVPKWVHSTWVQLFIASIIKHDRFRFTYGYKWTLARMNATTVRLPVDAVGKPDWLYMESLMKGLPFSAAIDAAQ